MKMPIMSTMSNSHGYRIMTVTNTVIVRMIPSSAMTVNLGMRKSREDMSLDSRVIMRPTGLESKNRIGEREIF